MKFEEKFIGRDEQGIWHWHPFEENELFGPWLRNIKVMKRVTCCLRKMLKTGNMGMDKGKRMT